jgi:SAM-dependent MidA family methyltransferase
MDLTTHIHLDTLCHKGEQVGLTLVAMLKQYKFLLRGGLLEYLQETYDPNPFSEVSKQNRAIRNLLLDDGISASFTVVMQKKELNNITIDDVLLHDF